MYTFRNITDYMNQGRVFTCKVVSYDGKRNQGGRLLDYEAKMLQADSDSGRGRTRIEQLKAELTAEPRRRKTPNHKQWYTRNIRLMVNGHPTAVIKKIHIPLIVEFNGQPVVA